MNLSLGKGFTLPESAVTEVISTLATRGAGKSFGSAVGAEELYAAGLQFVVIDVMGVYWGLRSGSDGGKKGGLPIIVLGGERGDVPLEATSGKLIADVVVDSGESFVLDLSQFDLKADQTKFVHAFADRLFYRKGPLDARTPLMVIVDEADEFMPQRPGNDETHMLAAMIRLAKRGRTRGIGLWPITQRSAELAKAVLDLSSAVVFMRTSGPRDRKVIRDWFKGQDSELVALADTALPKLDTGEAIVYSPHWLRLEEPLRVRFRRIKTFDSYQTPKPGQARVQPRAAAVIDLAALGEQIQATVERAKANDPGELRRRLRELERKLAERPAEVEERVVEKVVEVPVLTEEERQFLETEFDRISAGHQAMGQAYSKLAQGHGSLVEAYEQMRASLFADLQRAFQARSQETRPAVPPRLGSTSQRKPEPAAPSAAPPAARPAPGAAPRAGASGGASTNGTLPGPHQRVLDAIAWYGILGNDAPTKQQVGFIAGYRVGKNVGGTYGNVLGQLKNEQGKHDWPPLISYPTPGTVALTDEGSAVARAPDLEASNEAVQEAVIARLNGPEERVLRVLISRWPDPMRKQELGAEAGYTVGANVGGTFGNILGRLRSLGVIDYPTPGEAVATDVLFPLGPR